MPVTSNVKEIKRRLGRLNPNERLPIVRRTLSEIGLLVATNSQNAIKRGGAAKPLKTKLTSRSGTGRRSIRADRPNIGGVNRRFIDIGTDLGYMALHETGGTVTVRSHTRKSSKGNTFSVKSYQATYPRRWFLEPGLRKSRPGIEQIIERNLTTLGDTA